MCSLNLLLKQAETEYREPQVINSYQGCGITCQRWIEYFENKDIYVSIDGLGKTKDNIFTEKFWKILKYDYAYLWPAQDGLKLYSGIKEYMRAYIHRRPQGKRRQIPAELYKSTT